VAPEGAVARNLLLVQAEAVGDLLSLLGDDWNSALHVGQRRLVHDLASEQQAVEAVEICNGRYERGRWSHPGHVKDAVVTRRVDHAEPRLVQQRVRPADIRSGRELGVAEPSALNDVLGDAFFRGGTGDVLQELAEKQVIGVGIYPRRVTGPTDSRCPDPHLDQLSPVKLREPVVVQALRRGVRQPRERLEGRVCIREIFRRPLVWLISMRTVIALPRSPGTNRGR
jgi:hypothetical protein